MKTKEVTKKLSLTKDFEHFIDYHTELKGDEYKYVKNLFGQQHIKKTIRASLVLIIWSFINSFVDATMIGWSFVEVAMKGFSILHFVPWLLMVSFNMVAKYFFLGWVDTGNNFSHKQKVLATIPSVGVFLFLASVLAQEKLFLKVTRQYLRYVKRRGVKFILRLLGFSTLDY
jgi:hypothetical protein